MLVQAEDGCCTTTGSESQQKIWCEVKENTVLVEDSLFNYIKDFTHDKGRRHFLYTVAMVESQMNPYSGNGSFGEIGMMQVLPDTGDFVSRIDKSSYDLKTVRGNIFASLGYLNFILEQMDVHCSQSLSLEEQVKLAAAAYNGGAGHLAKGCSLQAYNLNARRYADRFMRFWEKNYMPRSMYYRVR
jgi:membrane-bound lytic murein transglycosylase MltF